MNRINDFADKMLWRLFQGVMACAAAAIIIIGGHIPAHSGTSAPRLHTVSGVLLGRGCTSTWRYQYTLGSPSQAPFSRTQWVDNQCSYSGQDRSICANRSGGHDYRYSGIVVRNGLWFQATCPSNDGLWQAARRYENTAWQIFYPKR